jgi:uncharacterized protein HemX
MSTDDPMALARQMDPDRNSKKGKEEKKQKKKQKEPSAEKKPKIRKRSGTGRVIGGPERQGNFILDLVMLMVALAIGVLVFVYLRGKAGSSTAQDISNIHLAIGGLISLLMFAMWYLRHWLTGG